MDDREFLDVIHQHWARTTGASDTYWQPEECYDDDGGWNLFAVGEKQRRHGVGWISEEADADFITAIHGALPDLVRRLHAALDEADRLDEERDTQEVRIARLEMEADEREREITDLHAQLADREDR